MKSLLLLLVLCTGCASVPKNPCLGVEYDLKRQILYTTYVHDDDQLQFLQYKLKMGEIIVQIDSPVTLITQGVPEVFFKERGQETKSIRKDLKDLRDDIKRLKALTESEKKSLGIDE